MKALLLFGVDHDLKDGNGFTAYEIAEQKQDSVMSEIKSALKLFSSIHRGNFPVTLLITFLHLKYCVIKIILVFFVKVCLQIDNYLLPIFYPEDKSSLLVDCY